MKVKYNKNNIFVGVISLQFFPEQQVMPKSSNVLIL